MKRKILITGAAGFIGAALAKKFLEAGEIVVGIDNLNNYYSNYLKNDRIYQIDLVAKKYSCFWKFYKGDIEDINFLELIFKSEQPNIVINLAAQAGVRYSIDNPSAYIQSNLVGFGNVLEFCRKNNVENLIYASSSSVYGGNKNIPFHENNSVNHPLSLYAATKKANELMAHTYSYLYNLPCTGLRFFTVYGPWGRPDMAPMKFANLIVNNQPIEVYNYGKMKRDFTYIDDIVEGIFRCSKKPATYDEYFDRLNPSQSTSFAPYRIFNIGNSRPVGLLRFIELLENALGIKAIMNLKPMQPGDVESTSADTALLEDWVAFSPQTSLETGIEYFAKWYKEYYQIA
tara:strand:+ start:1914 stop:2945 length:1032 start_codon:yes stop_codon:yes gene_type:complete